MTRNTRAAAYVIALALIVLAFAILNSRPQWPDFVLFAITAATAGACFAFIRSDDKRALSNIDAWRARASYQAMLVDCGAEYASVRVINYTSRDSRAHLRAYINARHPGLSKDERATLQRDAIAYAMQWLIVDTATELKDVNARPLQAHEPVADYIDRMQRAARLA
jgi:hypothetical protein